MKDISIYTKIVLYGDESFFGPGVYELLNYIDKYGSLQKACQQMNMSYSKGSKMLKRIENECGFSAVTRWSGGQNGGGALLTEEGKDLMRRYKQMEDEIKNNANEVFLKYFGGMK
jgi:molybdate transport system regulatory protein